MSTENKEVKESKNFIQEIIEADLESGKHEGRVHMRFPPCLLYTSPSPRDRQKSRMPSSA